MWRQLAEPPTGPTVSHTSVQTAAVEFPTRTVAVLCAALSSLFMALFYQQSAGWPITDMFPLIERLGNPDFLRNDFYTNTLEDYSGRHYVGRMFFHGAELLGVDYRVLVGWTNILRLFLTGMVTYMLLLALADNRAVALAAYYLGAVSFFALPLFVGYHYVGNFNTGHNLSLGLNLLAWALTARSRPALALAALAPSVLLHPVNGLHGFALAACILAGTEGPRALLRYTRQPLTWCCGGLFAAAFLAGFIPYQLSLRGIERIGDREFVEIIGHLRHPHHYIPSQFKPASWLAFIGFVICFAYMLARSELPARLRRVTVWVGSWLLLMLVTGYVFVEVLPLKWVASFQPYRALLVFTPLFLLVFGYYLRELGRRRAWPAICLLVLPFMPWRPFLAGWHWMLFDLQTYPRICGFLAAFALSIWWMRAPPADRKAPLRVPRWAGVLPILATAVLVAWAGVRLHRDGLISVPWEPVYRELALLVPEDGVILAEYLAASNQEIRLYSRRAVAASKDFPFNEKHFREWARRFRLAYGSFPGSVGHVDRMEEDELDRVADALGAEYIVRGRPVAQENHLMLLRFLPEGGRFGLDAYIYHNELPDPDATAEQP